MAHVATNHYSGSYAQPGGGVTTYTVSVDTGTGSNRAILISHYRRIDRAIAIQSVTLGGVAMEVLDSDRQVNGNFYIRPFALVDPSFTGTQTLVITCTTSSSNSSAEVIVSVYDDVDPATAEADLLVVSGSETETSPWTGTITLDVPSATGHQAVAQIFGASADVSYSLTESGFTQRLETVGGGVLKWSGDAAGATTVSGTWTMSGLSQDATFIKHGWDLPPPSSGQTITAGLNTETDSAFATTWRKARSVGLNTETDSAFAVAVNQAVLVAVGLASTLDSALTATWAKVRGLGLATETGTALTARAVRVYAAGLVQDVSTAFSVAWRKLRRLGLVTSVNSAFSVVPSGYTPPAFVLRYPSPGHSGAA